MVRLVEPRGKLEIFLPRAELCLSVVEGHLSLAMAERWIEGVDRYVRSGTVFDTFHDWEAMTGYDSAARQALTSWVVGTFRSFRSAHFLVTNRLARMGVGAASLAVAVVGMHMKTFGERAPFEKELDRFL